MSIPINWSRLLSFWLMTPTNGPFSRGGSQEDGAGSQQPIRSWEAEELWIEIE